MYKSNKKGFSFVELLFSLTLISMLMIIFVSVNGYLLRAYSNNKYQSEINNIIEITYYELKYNSSYIRNTTESQVVFINRSSVDLMIQKNIDELFDKQTTEKEYFSINIDCDYDEYVNRVKIEFISETGLKWGKVIYVSRSQI